MRWSERQRAMLAEMGLRPWFRTDDDTMTADAPDLPAVTAAPVTAAPLAASTVTPATVTSPNVAPPTPPSAQVPVPGDTLVSAPAEASWLIVGGPTESADDASRAAAEAEQELLLVHMLRAIGVSPQSNVATTRSRHVRTGTPAMDALFGADAPSVAGCVLVLGRAPAMALLGIDEPLGRLRGRVHAWRGVPVVVTFPLAYLLRNPGEKAKAWLDLCLAATAADAPAPS